MAYRLGKILGIAVGISIIFTAITPVYADSNVDESADESGVYLEPNTVISQFQDTIESLRVQNNELVSNYLKELYDSFTDGFIDENYKNYTEEEALLFTYSITRFVYLAQAFQVDSEGVADVRTIREYASVAIALKKQFSDQPKFTFLVDCIKSQFVLYLLKSGHQRQSEILYERIQESSEEYPEWSLGYAQLLATIEFSILQSEVNKQSYTNLFKYQDRIRDKNIAFSEDALINRLNLSVSLMALQYTMSSVASIESIEDLSRSGQGYYQNLVDSSTMLKAEFQLTRIRALEVMIQKVNQGNEKGRLLRDELVVKIFPILDFSLSCMAENQQCVTIYYYALNALSNSIPEVQGVVNSLEKDGNLPVMLPEWYTEYLNRMAVKIESYVLDSSQAGYTVFLARAKFKQAVVWLHNKEPKKTKIELLRIESLLNRDANNDIAVLVLKLRIALMQHYLASLQHSELQELLVEQALFDKRFIDQKDLVRESVAIQLSIIRKLLSQDLYNEARPILKDVGELVVRLEDESGLRSLITLYAQMLVAQLAGVPPVSWQVNLKQLLVIKDQFPSSASGNKIESRVRLSIVAHLVEHYDAYTNTENKLAEMIASYHTLYEFSASAERKSIISDELHARRLLSQCSKCSAAFLNENKKVITSLSKKQ